jgi:AcrR family transcriptional regulator
MLEKDYRDILGGLLMMGVGLFVAFFAYENYDPGNLKRMGPGFFPIGLGFLLALLGFFIALAAFFRTGTPIHFEWRTLILVTASILIFAALMKSMGIMLATFLAVTTSSLADREISWKNRILVALGVSSIVWLVFIYGLRMVLPTWPWSP